jgi:hypothetical protein
MSDKILLSFEMNENADLEIHGNRYGFDVLLRIIKEFNQNNIDDHHHLFADDLGDNTIGEKSTKIKQVKLVYWKDS